MKTEMLLIREGGFLYPADPVSWDVLDKVPRGSTIVVTVRKSRHPDHLKKYWALCSAVADADPELHHREDVDAWIRLSIPSMRDEIVLGDGRVVVKFKSIAIDEMDQTAFTTFYDKAVELMSMRLGMDVEQLNGEVSGRYDNARRIRSDQTGHRTGT